MGDQRRKLVRDGGQVQHIQTRPKQFVYAGDAGHILKAAARKARKTLRGGTFDIALLTMCASWEVYAMRRSCSLAEQCTMPAKPIFA